MEFVAECAASVAKNGARFVLLKFEPKGYLMGQIEKEFGELKAGKKYRITITEEE